MRSTSIRPLVTGAFLLAVACAPQAESPGGEATLAHPSGRPVPEAVLRMIEAHGGMGPWNEVASFRFTEEWGFPDGSTAPATRVLVEPGARRVAMHAVDGPSRIGWDGETAWSMNYEGMPPRFVTQLNFYFLHLPWLTMDPGVRLEESGTGRLWDDPTEYHLLKMTFDPGTGDTPDDFYDLYIDPTSHQLRACRYVVTYRALLQPGETHTPPHVLVYDEYATVGGMVVPTHFTIYLEDHSPLASCTIRDWSFSEPFDASLAAMPEGAVVDTTTP